MHRLYNPAVNPLSELATRRQSDCAIINAADGLDNEYHGRLPIS